MEGPEWQRLACWAGQKVEAGEGIEAKDLGGKGGPTLAGESAILHIGHGSFRLASSKTSNHCQSTWLSMCTTHYSVGFLLFSCFAKVSPKPQASVRQ